MTVKARGLMAASSGAPSRPGPSRGPRGNAVVHAPTTLTFTPTGPTDDLAEVLLHDGSLNELGRVTAEPWVITHDFTGENGRIYLAVKDRAGNVRPYQSGYQVDDRGPTIMAGFGGSIQPGKRWLTVGLDDLSQVTRVEWWIDGALRGQGYGVEYDFGKRIRAVPVEIRAWDVWGNASKRAVNVQLDATGPAISSVAPVQNTLVRGTSVATVVKATDVGGISRVVLAGQDVEASAEGVWSGTVRTGFDGQLSFAWEVYDTAGNVSYGRRAVIVDNTRPVITSVTAPSNGATVTGIVKTTVAATDANGIKKVELWINDVIKVTDSTAPFNLNLNSDNFGRSFTVNWVAYDKAGNTISTSRRTWKS